MASNTTEDPQNLIQLTKKLLDGIAARDYQTYESLVDESLTCFEPEAVGHLVEGRAFHEYYFKLTGDSSSPINTTMIRPHVRMCGDTVGIVCYARLTQKLNNEGCPETDFCEETRVWQKIDGQWKNVHFHRSTN